MGQLKQKHGNGKTCLRCYNDGWSECRFERIIDLEHVLESEGCLRDKVEELRDSLVEEMKMAGLEEMKTGHPEITRSEFEAMLGSGSEIV